MSYGFQAVNDNNQVLVSSDTRNLHFIQKIAAPRNTVISATDPDAGVIYQSEYFGGIRHWRYTATCATTPVPFFTMPTSDYHAVVRVENKGNNRWDIELIRSGTSSTAVTYLYSTSEETSNNGVVSNSSITPYRYIPKFSYPYYGTLVSTQTPNQINQLVTYPNAELLGKGLTTAPLTGNNQNGYFTVNLPWAINIGNSYKDTVYISTESFITFDKGYSSKFDAFLLTPAGGYEATRINPAETWTVVDTGINVREALVAAGWDQQSAALFYIPERTLVTTKTKNSQALLIEGSFPGGLTIVNFGAIVGRGGDGGRGASYGSPAQAGETGGTAIRASTSFNLYSAGIITGGGGGGGGGGTGDNYSSGGGAGGAPFGLQGAGSYYIGGTAATAFEAGISPKSLDYNAIVGDGGDTGYGQDRWGYPGGNGGTWNNGGYPGTNGWIYGPGGGGYPGQAFVFTNGADVSNISTLNLSRFAPIGILVGSGRRYAYNVYTLTTGTAPNRIFVARYEGKRLTDTTATASRAPIVWEAQFRENDKNNIAINNGRNSSYSGGYPEIYIFADARASTATETHGMIVYADDGTPGFDSRLKPLAITGGTTVSHPANPKDSFGGGPAAIGRDCSAGDDVRGQIFVPQNYNTFVLSSANMSKPMYFYTSVAQSMRESVWYDDQETCTGIDVYGNCVGRQTNQSWYSHYWAFFRGAIAYNPTVYRASTMMFHPYPPAAATVGLTYTLTQQQNIVIDSYYNSSYWDGTYITVNSPNFTTYTTASSNYTPRTVPENIKGDDGYWEIPTPWPVRMTSDENADSSKLYSKLYVSTNSYITFGGGSTEYNGLNIPAYVPFPKIMICASDTSSNSVYTTLTGTAPNRKFILRFEGHLGNNIANTEIGDPSRAAERNIKWEAQFSENSPDTIAIKFDNNQTGQGYDRGQLFIGTATRTDTDFTTQLRASNGTVAPLLVVVGTTPGINAGWVPVTTGCWYSYNRSSALFGINTGGGYGSGGVWPYTNETLNLTNNTLITADASRYD
jgi:hypothetical protein